MLLPDEELSIPRAVSDLALVALENGLAERWNCGALAPFVMIDCGGQCYLRRFEADGDAVSEAAAFLAREPETTETYALAYDGTVSVEGTPFDAILVIAGARGDGDAFVFTQRYDGAAKTLIGEPALIGQHDGLLAGAR